MLPHIADLLALPSGWEGASNIRIIEYEVDAGVVLMYKVRCDLPKGYSFQVRLRLWQGVLSYSYQLFSDRPVMRWDNAPHHPDLANFPHHFHDDTDTRHLSALTGDPLADLLTVRRVINEYLERHQEST